MQKTDLINYIKTTENNVEPLKVASGIQGVSFFSKLPRSFQNFIIKRSSKVGSTMSFIVEPYSTFLSFEIVDTKAAEKLLPPGYKLLPGSLFNGGEERLCAIVGAFNVHTSVFWGSRLEFYIVAENQTTGLLSWIIVSYETNTASFDPNRGFIGPTTSHSVVTTSYEGEMIVDVKSAENLNHISYTADLSQSQNVGMNERLWIEGNLSVDYGGDLHQATDPFALVFDPNEVAQGKKVSPDHVNISINTYGQGFLNPKPYEVAYFPYAQHFTTTTFPEATTMRTAQDLEAGVEKLTATYPLLK